MAEELTPEERQVKDKEARAKEIAEQKGTLSLQNHVLRLSISSALPYSWSQELGDVDVIIPVPKGTRGKQLSVVIAKKKLGVGLKGEEPIMSGELCKDIKVDDSTWTLRKSCSYTIGITLIQAYIEDNEAVHVHLEKLNQQTWWENVLTHHPKIDTTKIEPENSKLSDLDGDTR